MMKIRWVLKVWIVMVVISIVIVVYQQGLSTIIKSAENIVLCIFGFTLNVWFTMVLFGAIEEMKKIDYEAFGTLI